MSEKNFDFQQPGDESSCSQDEDTTIDIEGKVKARLQSFKALWNNLKYGMKLRTNFSKESPVWLLGRCYHRKTEATSPLELGTDVAAFTSQTNLNNGEDDGGFGGFNADFQSRIWMTYRREFPIMSGSQFTSDCGWGCMLRTGQMLIAQALVMHFLGRDWRWQPDAVIATGGMNRQMTRYRNIIKWFGDQPTANCPLSIHALVEIGAAHGKRPGDWYGPSGVAHLIREAALEARRTNAEFQDLAVYVSQDSVAYRGDIMKECTDESRPGYWRPLVMLIPMRLGADKFNPIYIPCVQAILSLEQCIGIIGGRPKHSLYFVGYQDDKLIHLDPHYCQDVVDVWQADFPLDSFHCLSPRKMLFSRMDPCCCVGFYCRTREEYEALLSNLEECTKPVKPVDAYSMFVFCPGHGCNVQMYKQRNLHTVPLLDVDVHTEMEEFQLI